MTKLARILTQRGMSQRDLQRAIKEMHFVHLGDDRISKMVNGILTNYQIKTARMIAETLNVSLDDIVE
jgi:transcriptional regulator with XRE-family HTH domain